jgi:hypothetical protein
MRAPGQGAGSRDERASFTPRDPILSAADIAALPKTTAVLMLAGRTRGNCPGRRNRGGQWHQEQRYENAHWWARRSRPSTGASRLISWPRSTTNGRSAGVAGLLMTPYLPLTLRGLHPLQGRGKLAMGGRWAEVTRGGR